MTVEDIKNLIITVAGATSTVVTIVITAILTAYNVYKRYDSQGKIPSVLSRNKRVPGPQEKAIDIKDLEKRLTAAENQLELYERRLAQHDGSIEFFRNRLRDLPFKPDSER